jgi:ferredoxin-NADP reductase/DMSO/TMAO reductase YedYZ heme-binding membrane subunit
LAEPLPQSDELPRELDSDAMEADFARKLVWLNGAVPALILAWDALQGQLGANSVNVAIHITGLLSLIFLFLSLLVTPLRWIMGWDGIISCRRPLGLYGFFYALLHFGIYFALDRQASIASTASEIGSRRFLLVGFLALMLLVPLAVTSTQGMIRRLGPRRWKGLHRLVYLVAILGVIHFYMQVKSDTRQPLAFLLALIPILAFRPLRHFLGQCDSPATASRQPASYFRGDLVVSDIVQESHNVKTFRLAMPDGSELPWTHQPGQFVTLTLDIDGEPVRRCYTIASPPTERRHIELSIKRLPEGPVSNWLHERVAIGNRLHVAGPAGVFWFDGLSSDSVVLVAAGIGITPLLSILRYLTDRDWHGEILLINVVSSPRDAVFLDELQHLSRRLPNVRVVNHFSREQPAPDNMAPGERWEIRSGRLSKESLATFAPELASAPVYLCGPTDMMTAAIGFLQELGVPETRLHTEEFQLPAESVEALEIAASSGSEIASTIAFTQSGLTIQVDGRKTILEAAEEAGIDLPWDCRGGICGTCQVRCVSGKVVMAERVALSVEDERQGYILACQSIPVSPHVAIEA